MKCICLDKEPKNVREKVWQIPIQNEMMKLSRIVKTTIVGLSKFIKGIEELLNIYKESKSL